ncbi:MAG TPA: heavy metal translocating P-type ATPase metal-binding domain-containing protein [Vicinamibacterales bacterium]|nr:heavy metal translocating P-type ATPase metal-binding domain-containing protein [Vicinamibacterales bacterium]
MSAAAPASDRVARRNSSCAHCGEPCEGGAVATDDGTFCCSGCASVFTILKAHRLEGYYACETPPGVSQRRSSAGARDRFAALDDPAVAAALLEFDDGRTARATFDVPAIHCASCVWLLEQLWRLQPSVRAEVDLLRRAVHVSFSPGATSLRRIADTMASLGYEPVVTPEPRTKGMSPALRRLYLQLGVAGFAAGNIMLFSVPRYLNGAPLDGGFQRLFDWLNLAFATPVLLFSGADYFRNAWQALRTRTMTLDVPVALGLAVLYARSAFEIGTARGEGFMDSFTGLVFFLLIGRLFQLKVFERIAFDRTYRSFLPLTVRAERGGGTAPVPIDRLHRGDVITLRRHEVVPADAVLLDERGAVDYAFITGEQTPVIVSRGEAVRAGGRAASTSLRLRIARDVSQSVLAGLWNNPVFGKPKERWLTAVAARFGAWFTVGAIGLAAAGGIAWWPDAAAAMSVATAVLIIACPCALTLSAPITLGTAMGMLGRRGLYLKHPAVALDLSRIDTIAFDKTGTLTSTADAPHIERYGLSECAWSLVRRLAGESVHPVSRAIAAAGGAVPAVRVSGVREIAGKGIRGTVDGVRVAIGTRAFIASETGIHAGGPQYATYASAGDELGWIDLTSPVRDGVEQAAEMLAARHELFLLSGDNAREAARWRRYFGERTRFSQSPDEKLRCVEEARTRGRHVLMVGDGLNDAGALAAADVGIAVSDSTACLVPACDALLAAERVADLPAFLAYARRARQVVLLCFTVSVAYNAVGLTLALAGALTPLASAILMPVSSLTIVGLSAGSMRWAAARVLPS